MKKSFFASLLALAVVVWIPGASVAGPFSGVDTDGDGVDNVLDNCTNVSNANQVDADGDGCGNHCDGDMDGSGITLINDFNTFKTCFPRTVGAAGGPADDPTCTESDMDGSGGMTVGDFNLFKTEFSTGGATPGPSGSPIKAGPPSCP
jgi:hypothetical protein